MESSRDATARRLALALDLFTTGEDLMRQRLGREHPEAVRPGDRVGRPGVAPPTTGSGVRRLGWTPGHKAVDLSRLESVLRQAARDLHDLDRRAAQGRGYRLQAVVEQEAARRLATVRFVPAVEDAGGVVVDALFASSGIEPAIVAATDTLDVLPGLRIPVATVGHLIALKILARDDAAARPCGSHCPGGGGRAG